MRIALIALLTVVGAAGGAGAQNAQRPHGALVAAGVLGLADVKAVATSPDGRNVYATLGIDTRSRLLAFARNRTSGALTQIPGRQGCLLAWGARSAFQECAPGAALNKPTSVAVTPDGRDVVLGTWTGYHHAAVYRRSRTGGLRFGACIGTSAGPFSCMPARAVARTSGVAVAPDGRSVYVLSIEGTDRGLAVFARKPASSALTQPDGRAGCVQRAGISKPPSPPCGAFEGRDFTPTAIAISPDGRHAYVTSSTVREPGAVFGFTRDPATGAIRRIVTCLGSRAPVPLTCQPLPALAFARAPARPSGAITISRDGRSVYVAGRDQSEPEPRGIIVELARDPATGALTVVRCLSGAATGTSCDGARGLAPVSSMALAPDERTLFAGTASGLAVFRRAEDGALSQLPGVHGCLAADGRDGCGRLPRQRNPLNGVGSASTATSLAVSPDGRFLYAAILDVFVFRVA